MNRADPLFNLLAISGAIVALAGGLIVRTQLPDIPFSDGDTWQYLRPALCWLSGLGFQQTFGRDWLYPAVLAGILKVSGNFCAITYVQRILGLAGIFIFWSVWQSWLRLLPVQRSGCRRICLAVALLFLLFYALSPQQALLENTIRPDAILAFFEMAYFYCLLSFSYARWRSRNTSFTVIFGGLSLGLSFVILLLKPSWGFSLGFTCLVLAAGAFGRAKWPMRFGPFLAGAVPMLCLVSLPKLFDFQRDRYSELFLPYTLVCVHAAQILETKQNQASSEAHGSDGDRVFYQELARTVDLAKGEPGHYHALGFNPDYILYSSNLFPVVQRKQGWNDHELAGACYRVYFRAWQLAPFSMLQKIRKQLCLFLFPRAGDFYSIGKTIDGRHELVISRAFLPGGEFSSDVQRIYILYLRGLETAEGSPLHVFGSRILAILALYLALTAFWWQAAFFVILTAICLSKKGRKWRLAGLVVVAVLAGTYGNVLTIAVVHSLAVVRYRISYAPAFLLGLSMIVNYLLLLVLARTDSGGLPAIAGRREIFHQKPTS